MLAASRAAVRLASSSVRRGCGRGRASMPLGGGSPEPGEEGKEPGGEGKVGTSSHETCNMNE